MSGRDDPLTVLFGRSLREEREHQKKTTREIARLAGMHASQISRLENGLADPKVSTVVRLARALQVTVSQLIEGRAPPPPGADDADHEPAEDLILDQAAYTRLGEALRRERESQGLTQEELALVSGLGRRAVGEVEAGKVTAEFRTWLAVIQALGFKLVIVRRHGQSSP
jgi:transcriptional regulator with XRE-family HTH domain